VVRDRRQLVRFLIWRDIEIRNKQAVRGFFFLALCQGGLGACATGKTPADSTLNEIEVRERSIMAHARKLQVERQCGLLQQVPRCLVSEVQTQSAGVNVGEVMPCVA
jgi:hypothetical protein